MVAAVFAFFRLGQQIKVSKAVNIETARKNREDQWWDTLKWTYEEAKASKSSDGPLHEVAAAAIFTSLKDDKTSLTRQQKQALESILDIFGESEQPEVQEAVAPMYRDLGLISPIEYQTAVGQMLMELNLGTVTSTSKIGKAKHNFLLDSGKKEVLIEVKTSSIELLRLSWTFISAMSWTLPLPPELPRLPTKADLVIVPNGKGVKLPESVYAAVRVVHWSPGQDSEPVREALTEYLELDKPTA